ncbi:MAG: endonuclease [Acholeplasmataceae bacterium]|jgi:endonuclease I|nr:endonuclease [Acholeplasmataceae bacterium]
MKKLILMMFLLVSGIFLISCQVDASLQTVLNNIDITFADDDSLSSVTTHLTFPLETNLNSDVTITWESSHPSIIDNFGTVNRPEVNTDVTLTVTVTLGEESLTKDFYVTVLGLYNDVTVTFKVFDEIVKSVTVKAGEFISGFSNPSVDGYTFDGWYVAPELTTRFEFTQPVNQSMTVEAKMTVIPMGSYVIELYYQNIDDELYTLESTTTMTTPIDSIAVLPVTFTGFTLNEELSDTADTVSDTIQTYKVYFDRNTYVVTFISEGVEVGTQNLTYGEDVILPTELVKENHSLQGWATNVAGTIPFDAETLISSDITIYAIWVYDAVYTDYYASLSGVTDVQLKAALRTLISQMDLQTYGDARYILDDTDRDPNNANNVILVYNRASVSGAWDGGTTWNREHVWPQSMLGASAVNEVANIASDLQNLKPANPSINSSRSNLPYAAGTGTHGFVSGGYFPGEADKGDLARILLYMHVRWNLIINTSTVGDLNLLLRWHIQDPVDDFERGRNELIYTHQDNRNPFIDHPEFAERIWGPIIVTSTQQTTTLKIEGQVPRLSVIMTYEINYGEFKKETYLM